MDNACERSSHTGSIPRSGGIAIVASFSIGFFLYYFFRDKYFIGLIRIPASASYPIPIPVYGSYEEPEDK